MPSKVEEALPPAPLTGHVPTLAATVRDAKTPLEKRFRALFTLRNINGKDAVAAIGACFEGDSELFKHECAYCLGQMQDATALPILTTVLRDEAQDVMVRHEAAEALGAIADASAADVLREYVSHARPEIAETCQIALDRIDFAEKHGRDSCEQGNPFLSVDPAPAVESKDVPELREALLDTSRSLFERYRALFALRNLNTSESTLALVDGFRDESALFRHEIGYVLGQMQNPAAIAGLSDRLRDAEESPMVRHECAEALGSIATDECLPILREFAGDGERVVRESCEVALDVHEYEQSGAFQYANGVEEAVVGSA